jgi:hypothetical protein
MFTICCYDPRVMETLCNLSADPYESHIKPMMTLVCEDAVAAAAIFYEMFDLLQWMNLNVRIDFNTIHFEFPEFGTTRLLNVLIYLTRHYISVQERNSFIEGVLYSTTSWVKVPVPVKWNEHTIAE